MSGAGRAVLYCAAISDRVRAGPVFSSFSTPLMSAVFTFALFVIGSLATICAALPNHTRSGRLASDGHRLSGAEFFRLERHQPGGHGGPVPGS